MAGVGETPPPYIVWQGLQVFVKITLPLWASAVARDFSVSKARYLV